MDRRDIIKKLGLLATAVYVAPAVVNISQAHASADGSSGANSDSGTTGTTTAKVSSSGEPTCGGQSCPGN